jgi:hypothetical protein
MRKLWNSSWGESICRSQQFGHLRCLNISICSQRPVDFTSAGLLKKSHDAQRRPCELKPTALKEAAEWMQQYREHWEESLGRLGEYLQAVTAKASSKQPTRKGKKSGR